MLADGLVFLKGEPIEVPVPGKITVIELWAKWCALHYMLQVDIQGELVTSTTTTRCFALYPNPPK